jgi:hypothetical protein
LRLLDKSYARSKVSIAAAHLEFELGLHRCQATRRLEGCVSTTSICHRHASQAAADCLLLPKHCLPQPHCWQVLQSIKESSAPERIPILPAQSAIPHVSVPLQHVGLYDDNLATLSASNIGSTAYAAQAHLMRLYCILVNCELQAGRSVTRPGAVHTYIWFGG